MNIHATNDVDRKFLEQQSRIVQRMRDFRLPYDAKRDQLYRHYVGSSPQRMYPDGRTKRSSNFVPYPFANVEQVRATLYEAFFAADPSFETLPRGTKDADAALKMQRVMELKVFGEAKFRTVIDDFLGGLCVYGFGALKVDWDYGYDLVPSWEVQPVMDSNGGVIVFPGSDQPMVQRVMVDKQVPRSRPKFMNIDIFDFLVDPDGSYCAVTYSKTLPELMREAEMYPDLYDPQVLSVIANELSRDPENLSDALIRMVEVWDAIEGTCSLMTTVDDPVALTYKDNRYAQRSHGSTQTYKRKVVNLPTMLLRRPYQPFMHRRMPILWTHYTKLPGEVYGMGVIEPTYNLIESLNRFTNLITDNWDLTVNQRLIVDATGDIDFGQMQKNNVPGGIIPGYGDISKTIREFPLHTPDQGSYAIIPLYRQMIESTAGISDFYDRGVGSSGGNSTATGISSVIQQSSKRKGMIVRRVDEDIITPALQLAASMIQQFITDEIEVRITDEMPMIPKINSDFLTIKPEELKGNFDFRMIGPTYMENRFVQSANLQRFLQIVMANPQSAQYLKMHPLLLEAARLHNISYPQRILLTEEEVAQMQADQLQQQLMMMAVQAKLEQETGAKVAESKAAAKPGPAKSGGRVAPPKDPVSGPTRTFAQQNGANALGVGNGPQMAG